MKIVKNYGYDRESRFVMDVFDDVISRLYYKWPLEKIEVTVIDSERGDVSLEGSKGAIVIGRENSFVKNFDRKGVEAIVIIKLNSLILKIQGHDFSDLREKYYSSGRTYFEALLFIEEMIERRKAARSFPDAVFYSIIKEQSEKIPGSYERNIRMGLSSLVFYKIDEWNSEFIKKMATPWKGHYSVEPAFEAIKKIIDEKGEMGKDDVIKVVDMIGKSLEIGQQGE